MKKRIPNKRRSLNVGLVVDKKEVSKSAYQKTIPFAKRFDFWLFLATVIVSVAALLFFLYSGNKNLADYDAIARLNISRKIVDSLTPGIAQLGGIWLPFPQMLFLPFIGNSFLWHSGLAGAFASMSAFILGAVFLYKTVYLITESKLGGFLAWLVYVANINMLFLQTMAMSESFFLFTLVMIIYFLTKWVKSRDFLHLMYAALFVILTTLTRYEGYALFGAAVLSVAAVSLATFAKNLKKVEGTLILFMTLAGFGIFLWSFYSFLIYKDPIYWLNLYSGNKEVIALDPTVVEIAPTTSITEYTRRVSLLGALRVYGSAMLFMNGILISLLALIGFVYLLFKSAIGLVKKRLDLVVLPILIMTACVFTFLIFGYFRGLVPNIETPLVNFAALIDKTSNFGSSSNIRYGIIVLPLVALLVGVVYGRAKYLAALALVVIAFQITTLFTTQMFLTFSLSAKATYEESDSARWFIDNYDGGLVLVSAHRHENFMFQTRLDYDNFIYEGNRQWWRNSLADPTRHATWVVLDENISGDAVNELIADRSILENRFDVVYQDQGFKIYKIKS